MKSILILTAIMMALFAKPVQMTITSKSFEADENKHKTVFDGNVVITKADDQIKASQATVIFDLKNQPERYIAKGHVTFKIALKNSTILGKCQKLTFVPKSKVYTLEGSVNINEEPTKRKIQATKVIIDTTTNKTTITGAKNKPVKFIFDIKEDK